VSKATVTSLRQVFGGAVLVIAGIAAFVQSSRHFPSACGLHERCITERGEPSHLSTTAYDLLRIGAWALVIVGVLVVITGLIRYWGAQRR
jgi:hypothetical protein